MSLALRRQKPMVAACASQPLLSVDEMRKHHGMTGTYVTCPPPRTRGCKPSSNTTVAAIEPTSAVESEASTTTSSGTISITMPQVEPVVESTQSTGARSCSALTKFAREQLSRAKPHVVNASTFDYTRQSTAAGLVVCVHDGELWYQESHAKHMWHGEADRAWGALEVIWQWLRRSKWRGATRCWQHSGRDDQQYSQGFGLPTMLWHYSPHQPWHLEGQDPAFLWPEHNYEGEVTRSQPPTRRFRQKLFKDLKPWSERLPTLRYRGSVVGSTRRAFLACPKRNSSVAGNFFATRADVGSIDWIKTHDNLTLASAQHRMDLFTNFQNILWLPGGCEWSSAVNQLMAYGAALYMPSDLQQSHSLNTIMLLERCDGCVISFDRRDGICGAVESAFLREEARGGTRRAAERLADYVRTELHPDCVDQYMTTVVEGLPQTVLSPEAIKTAGSPLVAKCNQDGCRGHKGSWPRGWRSFSCSWQLSYAVDVMPHILGPGAENRHNVHSSLQKWWDPDTCANSP